MARIARDIGSGFLAIGLLLLSLLAALAQQPVEVYGLAILLSPAS